jgi:hypothetical protein
MTKELFDHQHARLTMVSKSVPVEQRTAKQQGKITMLFIKLFKASKNL